MNDYKTRIPGIDRSSEAKNPTRSKSSSLQMGTKSYTAMPGTSATKFLGNMLGNKLAGKLLPGKYQGGQTAGGKALDMLGGPIAGLARGLFGKK